MVEKEKNSSFLMSHNIDRNTKFRPSLLRISNLENRNSSFTPGDFEKNVIQLKVIVLGDPTVGKTSIIKRLQYDTFNELHQPTLAIDCSVATFQTDDNGNKADVLIWDTCGSERFKSITKSYYKEVNGIVLVYDIKSQSSFDNLEKWLYDIDEMIGENKRKKSIPIIICGNKCEELPEKRKVDYAIADNWCVKNNFKHIECSAKSGLNVRWAFEELTLWILQKIEDKSQVFEMTVNLNKSNFNPFEDSANRNSKLNISESCFKDKSYFKDNKEKKKNGKGGCC